MRLISANRLVGGESYVAGGVALNTLLGAPRLSRDIDTFNDSIDALKETFSADSDLLLDSGYTVEVISDNPTFVEALIRKAGEFTALQWAQDSAFRFFPLQEHPELGLTLHPFDLATNKVGALVGRAVPRDWVDIIECDARLQPLGYLAWAMPGKDPGMNPSFILSQAGRSARYTEVELEEVEFEGPRPSAAELSHRWHAALDEAWKVVDILPWQEVGACILSDQNELLTAHSSELPALLEAGRVRYHHGSIKGAFPIIIKTPS